MRKKIPAQSSLLSWTDVDNAMKMIGECERCIEEIVIELNRQQAAAKEQADEMAQQYHERIKSLDYEIREYVTQHRGELDGKTRHLNFGSTGFRLSTKLMTPKPADIIANLKQHQMLDCITVKESINKDVLKRYPTDDIVKTGAYLKVEDEFWREIERETLQSTDA